MEALGFVASFVMGVTLGTMGGGGAILTVPILVYLFNIPATVATSYSLFIVGMSALLGSAMYIRKKDIDFRAGISFALPSMIGVHISRGSIIPRVPAVVMSIGPIVLTKDVLIMTTFAILMIAASLSMIKGRNEAKPPHVNIILRIVAVGLRGLVVGLIAGFVGAGGGFLIIPTLVLLIGLSMKVAVGTSLMIIAIQSLFGFGGDILRGFAVDWIFLVKVSAVAAVGIAVGSAFVHKVKEEMLKKAFGWFVLAMGAVILLEQFHRL